MLKQSIAKKYFQLLIVFLLSFYTHAQGRFNAGASFNIGFPAGSLSEVAKTGIGFSLIGEYSFNNKLSGTLLLSYQNFPGDLDQLAIQGKSINFSVNSLPFLAGLRYYFSNDLFGTIELGTQLIRISANIYDLYNNEKYSTDYQAKYSGGIGAGYHYKLAKASVLELSGLYQFVEDEINSVSLRLGILILLDKI